MKHRSAARMEVRSSLQAVNRRKSVSGPLVIASVSRESGPLTGMDRVRIDASDGTLRDLARLRSRYRCPAMLDLPGPGTGRVSSPLTTSEYLVFASAEGFEWASLRGVTEAESVHRARATLHPSVRLVATISHPSVLTESLGEICDAADAVTVSCEDLRRAIGADAMSAHVQFAIAEAARRSKPCYLIGGLLSSLRRDALPTQRQMDEVDSFVVAGASGIVLGRETSEGNYAQAAIDIAQMIVRAHDPAVELRTGAARIEGAQMIVPGSLSSGLQKAT